MARVPGHRGRFNLCCRAAPAQVCIQLAGKGGVMYATRRKPGGSCMQVAGNRGGHVCKSQGNACCKNAERNQSRKWDAYMSISAYNSPETGGVMYATRRKQGGSCMQLAGKMAFSSERTFLSCNV